jgi:signal transduction histidine kinase
MRWPAPTIRLRLALLYGVVFLITGAVLLTLGYLLVHHNLDAATNYQAVRAQLKKEGIPVLGSFPGPPFRPSFGSSVVEIARQQLRDDALHRLLIEYVLALGLMTIVSVVAGWLLAGRALSPLRRITATARRVSVENLGERIALSGPADELRELADTFVGMLVRLENTFQSQRHFVANASHELRTPLAIMRTEVDVALADPDASEGDLRRMGEAVRETIDRCERLLESLLMLARSEAAAGREERVDLASLAGDCVTDLRARAREAGVRLRDDLQPAWVSGEPGLLERMVANLVDNGIRYNVRGGALDVTTRRQGASVTVTVANGGARIDPDRARDLVEPFQRLQRGNGGFGLGLSIVRSVVKAHHGTLQLTAPEAGGLTVNIELPAAPSSANLTFEEESRALTHS